MEIVKYPHPTLRHKSKPIRRVNKALKNIVAEMFELMYEANGIGLAANQVDLPFRLFIVNLTAKKGDGEELVFINPVVSSPKGSAEAEEGCLSLPGVYAPVVRPEKVQFNAYSLAGEEFEMELDGLMARVVQHETDHVDGVMFIDRLSTTNEMSVEEEVADFIYDFESSRESGEIPDDETITKRLKELEGEYC